MALYSDEYPYQSSNLYSISFEYLDRADVKVSVNGVDTTDPSSTYTFAFANDTQISLTPNSGIVGNGVRVYRETNTDQLDVTFFPGSAIRAADLNKNFEQNNFATQEVKERFLDRTGGAMEGILDMGGYKITNGADGTDANDFITFAQLNTAFLNLDADQNVIAPTANVAFTGTTQLEGLTVSDSATFNTDVTINSTGFLKIPVGTNAQQPGQTDQPAAAVGQIRFNTDLSQFEGYHGGSIEWASIGGGATGGGGDTVFVETSQLITTDYTLTTGATIAEKKNAMSAGPVTIDPGVTVTVPAGQSWVIV